MTNGVEMRRLADAFRSPAVATVGMFALGLLAVVMLRREALETPFFWDEVGYYIPNALSMLRHHLYPIPVGTVPQSYPPLQPYTLVAGWWLMGFSVASTRIVVFVCTAATLASTYALGRRLASPAVGVAAAALTLCYPVFLGQAGFAQPEILLALFTNLAVLTLVQRRMAWHAVAIVLLLMTKWTAIVALPAFGLYLLCTAPTWRKGILELLWYLPGLLALAGWFAFFFHETGSITSTDAHYAKVNLWDNLNAQALVQRGAIRIEQFAELDGAWLLYAPMLIAAAVWLWRRAKHAGTDDTGPSRPAHFVMLAGVAALYIAFLTISGFLLPRYFVPVQPLFAVMGAAALFALLPRIPAAVASAAVALVFLLTWYGWFPSRYPPLLDMRPAYADVVRAHAIAAQYLETNYSGSRVVATWPVLDAFRSTDFGYVTRPLDMIALDSLPEDAHPGDDFDLLLETPIPQNPNPARAAAERMHLAELGRFEVNDGVAILWGKPQSAAQPMLYNAQP